MWAAVASGHNRVRYAGGEIAIATTATAAVVTVVEQRNVSVATKSSVHAGAEPHELGSGAGRALQPSTTPQDITQQPATLPTQRLIVGKSGGVRAAAAVYDQACRGERSPQESLRAIILRRMRALDRLAHHQEREAARLPHR